jgi:glycosyltransferase involved in cell wall biosynthesis
MDLPKISIVTPSYNQEQFLEATITSVLNQEYPNIEYIIIDGGSTDNTVNIIKKYENRLAYWVSEPDRGQTDAIMKGLERSTGEIFAWQNSDDCYLPGTLKYIAQLFLANPEIDLLFGSWNFIDSNGKFLGTRHLKGYSLMKLKSGRLVPPQPAVFFRKESIVLAGNLNIYKQQVMDYDLYVRIARTKNVLVVDKILGEFRIHKDSKTVSNFPTQMKELIETRRDHFGKSVTWNERVYWLWTDIYQYGRYSIHKYLGLFSFRDLFLNMTKKLKVNFKE